jgi:PAS domain S-box-containing protein
LNLNLTARPVAIVYVKTRTQTHSFLRYLYATLAVAAALGVRVLLLPWTGYGAPFVLFFGAVVVSGFLWGVGPGILSGLVAGPIAAYLFVYQAGYTVSQAIAQSMVFLVEVTIVCVLADRFARAKRRSELNERAARHAEAQLKKWQNIFEKADWGVIVGDPRTDKLEMVNPGFASMLGYSVDDLVGRPISDIFTPESRLELRAHLRKGDDLGHHVFEATHQRKDGGILPVMVDVTAVRDERGEVLYRAFNIRDLTDIHEARLKEREARARVEAANAALLKSGAELREAQRLAHVGNWSWDAKNDTVQWSEETYRIFGLDPKLPPPNFYGEHSKLFTPESMASLRAAVEKTLKDAIPYAMELELVRPDDSTGWISARGEPIRDVLGRIAGLYGTVQDITQLKQLQRMREEWTSVIAHDLRQPIGNITMCVDLLPRLHGGEINEREQLIINRVHSAAVSLARMVDDLLDVSRIEAQRLYLDRKWVDPRTVVRESIERLSHITRGFRVSVSESGDLSPVFADPMRIEQVLGNLFSNAAKYGDRGSEILVRLDRRENEIKISVTNYGPGISPDELPRLFDRFSRSKSSRNSTVPGLGLGLYISKGLVEAHGGRIWVESIPGNTTTFNFTLPVRMVSERGVA